MICLLSIFACSSGWCPPGFALGEDGDCHPQDTSAPEDAGPRATGTWTLGPLQDCPEPVALSYSDQSDRLPVPPENAFLDERGEVAMVGDRLVFTTFDRGLAWVELESGEWDTESYSLTFLTMASGDLDGDGRPDLVLAGEGLVLVYAWGTDDQREEVLVEYGTWSAGRAIFEVLVVDLDQDGDADIFAGFNDGTQVNEDNRSGVFWNEGGDFDPEPTLAGGEADRWGMSFDAVTLDLDGDGDLDVYECNDRGYVGPNTLIQNDGQGGLDAVGGRGSDCRLGCMSVSFADFSEDGVLDMYLGATGEHLILTRMGDDWVDTSNAMLEPLAEGQMVWGSAMADLDNDGTVEIVAGTGDFVGFDPVYWPFFVGVRGSDGVWTDQSEALGFPQVTGARAVLARDFNGDGVLDVLAGEMSHGGWLMMSDGCTAENWLEIEAPTGSIAHVEAGGVTRTVLITDEPGYGVWAPPIAHVGLGAAEQVDSVLLEVPWEGWTVLEGPFDARRRVRYGDAPLGTDAGW